jgi:hypothetical protein
MLNVSSLSLLSKKYPGGVARFGLKKYPGGVGRCRPDGIVGAVS